MTAFASGGQVVCGAQGSLHVRIWGELHYVSPEDLGRLLFMGERVPLFRKGPAPDDVTCDAALVSGSACLSPSGRSVIIATGSKRYMLPRDRFLAVGLGEEISCISCEVPSGEPESGILMDAKGCAVP